MATPNKISDPSSGPDNTRRPLTYVGIHSNSEISWEAVPSRIGSVRPVILHSYKDGNTILSGVGSQNVSVVQHIPPTSLRPQIENHSMLHETSNSSNFVSSSSEYDRDGNDVPLEPSFTGNYREDIDMDDKQLLLISTKELNRVLKKKGVSKARQKEIKSERRTLKNRGYASTCRVSRDEEEQQLQKDILEIDEEIKSHPPEEYLKAEHLELKREIKYLKKELNISDDSNDSDDFPFKTEDLEDNKDGIKDEIKEESSDDDYALSDDSED